MVGVSFTLVTLFLLLLLLQLSSSSGLRAIPEDGYGDHHPFRKVSIIQGQCRNPLFFVFGASMVDVGGSTAMKPYSQGCNFPPYGLDYFPEPAGRWSNGRTIIDFISNLLLRSIFVSSLHHSKHHSESMFFALPSILLIFLCKFVTPFRNKWLPTK